MAEHLRAQHLATWPLPFRCRLENVPFKQCNVLPVRFYRRGRVQVALEHVKSSYELLDAGRPCKRPFRTIVKQLSRESANAKFTGLAERLLRSEELRRIEMA